MSLAQITQKRWIAYLLAAGWLLGSWVGVAVAADKPLVYPKTRKGDVVEDYHGTKVADPYRWMEDQNSPERQAWVEAQNKLTFGYLEQIPERNRIKERLTKLWNYEKYGMPVKRGDRYFYSKNDGLQNQSVLYTSRSLTGEARVLIDPNKLSADGTVALGGQAISDDGKLFAYGISVSGSDWREWKVRDVDTGKDLGDHLRWVKFSGASWTKDGKGFFYSRYPKPDDASKMKDANYFQKLYYHRIGTPQSQDTLIFEQPDHKEWFMDGSVTDDGRYLIITVTRSTADENMVYYKDLTDADGKIIQLIDGFEAEYSLIDNDGPVFWFKTNLDAPRGRVIAIDTRKPEPASWKQIIPQAEETLRSASVVGNRFIASYLKHARSQVKVFELDGRFVREVPFPAMGSAGGFGGKRADKETFYSFTSFSQPSTIYRYDVASGKSTVLRQPTVDFNPDDYVTEQIFYRSEDRTRVPMFVSYKKGLTRNGKNPAILYGYGGFNIAITPSFRVSNLVWMEMGGVYAVANIRGGGEYGKEWHEAGTKLNKQNVFDDFLMAARGLALAEYTSASKLAIKGGSNGGLLVGACMTQRPGLFAACLPAVGVMDMLRFHKFTIGWAWTADYGSSENPEEFKALYAYSPLHNVKPGTSFPATMITTADHDDRVVPAHSFKFAAAVQAAQSGPAPILIRIQTKAGHGAGKPTTMRIEEAADQIAFLVKNLGVKMD